MKSDNTPKPIYIGLVTAYLTILAPILAFVFSHDQLKTYYDQTYEIVLFVIVLFILPFIVMWLYNYCLNKYNFKMLKKRKLSAFIIEKHEVSIDISKKGKLAHYFTNTVFSKAGKAKDSNYESRIMVESGTIHPTSFLNCSQILNDTKNLLQIYYTDQTSQLNNYKAIVTEQDKFLTFSAVLKNVFTNKQESWDLIPLHYCRNYNLQIILPKKEKLKSTAIFKVETINGKEVETKIYKISPITTKENGRYKIIMQIVDYDYPELIRLKWEIY